MALSGGILGLPGLPVVHDYRGFLVLLERSQKFQFSPQNQQEFIVNHFKEKGGRNHAENFDSIQSEG